MTASQQWPMSLEDLPNDMLGEILRRAEGFDKIRLTQASPLMRRLCKGPQAVPGVLGPLNITVQTWAGKPVSLNPGPSSSLGLSVRLDPSTSLNTGPNPLEPLLAWVFSRARAFSAATFPMHMDDISTLLMDPFKLLLASLLEPLSSSKTPLTLGLSASEEITDMDEWSSQLKALHSALPALAGADLTLDVDIWGGTSEHTTTVADAFAQFKNLVCLHLTVFVYDSSGHEAAAIIDNIKLSPTWTKLRELDLQRFPVASLSSLCDSMAPFPALETVQINFEAFERSASPGILLDGPALVELSALEKLPALSSLSLIGFRVGLTPESQPPPGFSFELPNLTKLHLGLILDSTATTGSFPFGIFSCPRARTLVLSAFSHGGSATVVDSLTGFPSLEHFFCDARESVTEEGGGNGQLVFDLRGVDFRDTPRLSFLQIFASGFELDLRSSDPSHLSLPLTRAKTSIHSHSDRGEWEHFSWDSTAQLVEFGDGTDPESRAVVAELKGSELFKGLIRKMY